MPDTRSRIRWSRFAETGMRYSEMSPEQAECRKKYLSDRYRRLNPTKPPRVLRSAYRFKNDGNGSGITEHKVIVEKVLGKSLGESVEIHHVDGNGQNNSHANLVVCPDHAYHALLHRRQRALDACGNANWLKCVFCKQYDAPEKLHLYIPKDQVTPRANHVSCSTGNRRKRKGVLHENSLM